MYHVGIELGGKIDDDHGVIRAKSCSDDAGWAGKFGNFHRFSFNDNALFVAHLGPLLEVQIRVAFGFATLLYDDGDSHGFPSCIPLPFPQNSGAGQIILLGSNESLEVLVPANEAGGARGREFHAGLAQGIAGGQVVFRIDMN